MKGNGAINDPRALRQALRLNQRQFWSRLGITQSGGSRYETGRRMPKTVKALLTLAYGKEREAEDLMRKLRSA